MREISIFNSVLVALLCCQAGSAQQIRSLPTIGVPASGRQETGQQESVSVFELPPITPVASPSGKRDENLNKITRLAALPGFQPAVSRQAEQVLELGPIEQLPEDPHGDAPGPLERDLDPTPSSESNVPPTEQVFTPLESAKGTFQPLPTPADTPRVPGWDAGLISEPNLEDSLTWWKSVVANPLDPTMSAQPVDANILVYLALRNSPRIEAISQEPLIRELQVVEADSEFDAVRYVRSQFEDRVDPVGNTLTVGGGESFLKDNLWSADAGFRRKARNGAAVELNQRLGFQNSNSNFFFPQNQGTATLALNVTQPLLRGRGAYVNQAQILIAQAAGGASWETFQAELQDELLSVISGYWRLYLNRSVYLQKKRNVERGEEVLNRLEGRNGLDSLPNQITRARSSVQTRKTELANALRDVRNAETEIRRLIADTSWMGGSLTELVPAELPQTDFIDLPLEQIVATALAHRPEIREVMNRARIATIQEHVSANDLLPELSLLFGTYVSALRADSGILNAFQDQFGQVKPGYNVGFNFEVPYRNRAARSRLAQRRLQVRVIRAEVAEIAQNVIAESQIALRRVKSAGETLVAAEQAIRAARADREQFEKRWEAFALVEGDLADGQTPTTVLDQLLESHDRLASAELVFVQSEQEMKVAEFALQRAMGTLLMRQNVTASRSVHGDTPQMNLLKDGIPVESDSVPAAIEGIPVNEVPIEAWETDVVHPVGAENSR